MCSVLDLIGENAGHIKQGLAKLALQHRGDAWKADGQTVGKSVVSATALKLYPPNLHIRGCTEMKGFIETLFAIIALVGAEAWFLAGYYSGSPDYEPALAFLAALGFILARDSIRAKFAKPGNGQAHDKELFNSLLAALPPNQTSRFFREHDFGGSFQSADVKPLYRFADTWESVENEFLDQELERKNKDFYKVALDLASEISGRTVPLKGNTLSSVYSDNQRNTGGPRPPSVIEDAKVLNLKSAEFVKKYEEFVRVCRAKLKHEA